eukprot:2950643-Prymnesium_polylepis.2
MLLPKYAMPRCDTSSYGGTDFGTHVLCERPSTPHLSKRGNCTLLSYGISDDCTFEVDVRRRLGCRVFGLDPTVTLPAIVAPGCHFKNSGQRPHARPLTQRGFRSARQWRSRGSLM